MRNRLFDAVLLRQDGGNWEVPRGGSVAQEDHERVLQAVIWAGSPNQEPGWPAFLEGGGGNPTPGRGVQCLATTRGTRHRRSPSNHTSGGAGDSGTHKQCRQRPGRLAMSHWESGPAPGRPSPGPLMANTERKRGGGAHRRLSGRTPTAPGTPPSRAWPLEPEQPPPRTFQAPGNVGGRRP